MTNMANENDVFNPTPVNDDVTADTLVGEGKKYADVNQLAKGYVNAEEHLSDLKRDLAMIRAENDLLKSNSPNRPNERPDDGNPPADQRPANPNTPTPPTEIDFRETVRKELESFNEESRAKSNMEEAARRLVDHYGDTAKANEAVRKRASELGVSAEWLRDAAARSPQAFYASMGINSPSAKNTPAPRQEFVPQQDNLHGEKKYRDFAELRKTNKALYYSAETQREMQEQAKKLGAAFYS